MWTSLLTIKVHHKIDTIAINQDSLMILYIASTNGNKQDWGHKEVSATQV